MGDKPLYGPIYNIPEHMVKDYCMGGRVPIKMYFHWGDFGGGDLTWTNEYFQRLLVDARDCIDNENPKRYLSDVHLVRLLKRHPFKGGSVLIIGSETPFYEAMVVQMGGTPVTVEYRKIHHDIPGLQTFTAEEFETVDMQFDCALSVSSIEHSGLGRYGDPLDPDGDFKAMDMYRRHMKPGGLLYLQIPVGPDLLEWNAHRVYGPARLSKILEGWEIIEAEGFDQSLFKRELGFQEQPCILLRKPME